MQKDSFPKKYRPGVARHWLWLIAGLLWSAVGIMLCIVAGLWLSKMDWTRAAIGAGAGFGLGFIVYRYGFSRIARKNIYRIAEKPNRVCVFAFQAWRSYLLIAVMMTLGFVLRHSPLPRLILAVMYSGIGTGLALSSTLYYQEFVSFLAIAG